MRAVTLLTLPKGLWAVATIACMVAGVAGFIQGVKANPSPEPTVVTAAPKATVKVAPKVAPKAAPKLASAKAVAKPAEAAAPAVVATRVAPLDLVKSPEGYVGKSVVFDGTFNSFGTLGLDYKKALRDGNKYLSVILLRPDVDHHSIPLSELKLFVARKNSDKLMDLETGDEVRIQGSVFSAALGDPWVDVDTITVTRKAHPSKANDKK